MGRWVRWQGSGLELREGRVSLEGLGERHAIPGAEVVAGEAAQTAKEGDKGQGQGRALLCGRNGMGGWVRWQGSTPEHLEGRINLERLGDRHATLGAEVVPLEAAQTGKEGSQGPVHVGLSSKNANPCPWFEGRPSCAHLSSVSVVFVFSAAATSAPSSAPSWLEGRCNSVTL